MKTSLKQVSGWSALLALVGGLAATAFAGPSPQYWQQQERLRAGSAAKMPAAASATSHDHRGAMSCQSCKTTVVTASSATNVSGKFAPRSEVVSSKHECAACSGAITTVRGKTTDEMKSNCPLCAKAKASNAGCCVN